MTETFDFIVVGGGSAGCVVATRLSEDPDVSVLLIEAGGDERRRIVELPEEWEAVYGSEVDWDYETTRQEQIGHTIEAHRGKVLGGSGSINNMTYFRGHHRDYEEWCALGADGWDYAGVLPYFKRCEDVPDGDPRHRGRGGPLHPRPLPPHSFSTAFVEGAGRVGHPFIDDLNGPETVGAGYLDMLILDGRRESTATAFLRPVFGRGNLTVRTEAVAWRLLLRGDRCQGVEYVQGGGTVQALASDEVVLCAGAVASPALLLRSGIGPADELAELGIDAVVDAPGVGRNLQDHMLLAGFRYGCDGPTADAAGFFGEANVLIKTDPGDHGPDLHAFLMEGDYHRPWQEPLGNSFTICIGQMRPRSRGSVRLAAADPDAAPVIDVGYLTAEGELDQLIAGVEAVDEILSASDLERWPGRSEFAAALSLGRADLEHRVREAIGSYQHLVGTCRMGSDDEAVLDPELRVNGVAALRVADASVMPVIVTSNTNAASIMIGEKASDLLRGRVLRDEAEAVA